MICRGLRLYLLLGFALVFGAQASATVTARQQMVAAAHPLAAEAGLNILRKGGSALDAAIAVQMVLGLVEPQSSGIGGGAFLLYWDASKKQVAAYDGRETAPAGVTPDLFMRPDGQPMGFREAFVGGRSVGVPGVIAMLALAHQQYGKLPWAELFQPAIALAEQGFEVTPRLRIMLGAMPSLPSFPAARALYFTTDIPPQPLPAGSLVRNPDYARSLRLIADGGAAAFYTGPLAQAMVAAVAAAPGGGALSLADLAAYRAKPREAVCGPYRKFRICGMPPPSSGGIGVLQILGMLERIEMSALRPGSVLPLHLLAQAERLAFADRNAYLGDADFVPAPAAGLLDKAYLAGRAKLITLGKTPPSPVPPGQPARRADFAPNADISLPSTSHFSIVDRDGNAVSMTSSVEAPFGSHVMAGGFFLNNQLTDFSFVAEAGGRPVANAVAAGKRPLSTMAPTLVFDADGAFYASLGSPGGTRIIGYVAQTLVGLLDWNLGMQQAIDMPRMVNRNGPLELEAGTALEQLAPRFGALGHQVEIQPVFSGLQGIRVIDGHLEGAADRRREGVALGD